MTTVVEVPGVGEVEFPDSMSREQITAAVQKLAAKPAAGSGNGLSDFGSGLINTIREQGYGLRDAVTNAAMIGDPQRAAIDALLRQKTDQRRLENPVPANAAGTAGAITGALATTLPMMLVPGANTVTGAGLLGAMYGAAQPVGSNDSRWGNTWKGGAMGAGTQGALNVVGKVVQPVKNALSQEGKDAVALLKAEDIPLSVAQQTGSKAAQKFERFLSDNPFSASSMERLRGEQGRGFTRAFVKTMGENADSAGPSVLGPAEMRIGNTLNTIEARYQVNLNEPQTYRDLMDVLDTAIRKEQKPIVNQIEYLVRQADASGNVPAETVSKVRQEIASLAKRSDLQPDAGDLLETIRDSLQRAMSPEDAALYSAARGQYRNMKSLDSAVDKSTGQISPSTLASRLNSGAYTKKGFRYGTGDQTLNDLARAGASVADKFPNSGTAARLGMQFVPAGAGAAYGYATGDEGEGLKRALTFAALGYGLPKAAASLLTTPAVMNYLAQGVPMPAVANQIGLLAQRTLPYAGMGLLSQSGR